MQSATQTKKGLWAGGIISALVVLFLVFDSGLKVLRLAPAVEGTARLGYPASLVLPIGIAELICVALFVIPRTSILGAIPGSSFPLLSACSFGEGLSCATSGCAHSFRCEVSRPATCRVA